MNTEVHTHRDAIDLLKGSFEGLKDDPRVKPVHLCLFTAILLMKMENDTTYINWKRLMKLSKIKSNGAYFQCLKVLQEVKLIVYTPGIWEHVKPQIILCSGYKDHTG
jgi:hypothetical protein